MLAYSFVLSLVIGTVLQKTIGFRVTEEDEISGIDSVVHAETAYDLASLGGGGGTTLVAQAHAQTQQLARNTEGSRA